MTKLEKQEDKVFNQKDYVERLLVKLGDGKDWVYEGEVIDANRPTAHCACGHSIRYEFIIHRISNHKETLILGSECINHFQYINPGVYESLCKSLEELKEKIKEEKRKIKEAQEDAAVQEIRSQWLEVRKPVEEQFVVLNKLRQEQFLPYETYSKYSKLMYFLYTVFPEDPHKKFKQKKALAKWYQRSIDGFNKEFPNGNVPERKSLRSILLKSLTNEDLLEDSNG